MRFISLVLHWNRLFLYGHHWNILVLADGAHAQVRVLIAEFEVVVVSTR